MPGITFVLPHWMYWAGLVIVPLTAMYIVRKQQGQKVDGIVSKPIAYLLWVCGGFAGLHRFYVKSLWGIVYVPLFIGLLLSNAQYRTALNLVSGAKNEMSIAEFDLELAQDAVTKGSEGARQKLEKAGQALETARQKAEEEKTGVAGWILIVRIFAIVIALLLLVDAFLLPKLVDRCAEKEARESKPGGTQTFSMPIDETVGMQNKWFFYIDKVNGYVGEFVCFWAIVAVFVYYYEVLVRYIFNSPTNWAHEGMFLMFGMQYMLAAGFTNREGSNVSVDILYKLFPKRVQVLIDVLTSVFFLIFVIALFWTGWVFAADSIRVWEVSFTEWAIQYWPVKMTLSLGALLLLLDGLTKLITDVRVLVGKEV
ncbi:MAG: TRAP transporter small permease subunit [bacterium]|nr:TRAP transporter small permease subunit [bacterium]